MEKSSGFTIVYPMKTDFSELIWLIRHGQSAANAGLATEHPKTIPLTPLGQAQSEKIAQQIPRQPDWIAISPFQRTADSAAPCIARFPNVQVLTWPIQELTYLSPARCRNTCAADRQEWGQAYWAAANPQAVDGEGAESFIEFMARVQQFGRLLLETPGFGLVYGHGMFLKAFLIGLVQGFEATPSFMQTFRQLESAQPLKNGQIITVSRHQLKVPPC
jgi:broad specificity phosphatase PhoE